MLANIYINSRMGSKSHSQSQSIAYRPSQGVPVQAGLTSLVVSADEDVAPCASLDDCVVALDVAPALSASSVVGRSLLLRKGSENVRNESEHLC